MKSKWLRFTVTCVSWAINFTLFGCYATLFLKCFESLGWFLTWVLLTPFAIVAVDILLRLYDWSGKDWLYIQEAKRRKQKQGWVARWFSRLPPDIRISFLSVKLNPFLVMLVHRKRDEKVARSVERRNLILSAAVFNIFLIIIKVFFWEWMKRIFWMIVLCLRDIALDFVIKMTN